MAVDVLAQRVDGDFAQASDVDGVDLAGGDELLEHGAADVEALGGVFDGQQNAVVGVNGDVQRVGSRCGAGFCGAGSAAAWNKSQGLGGVHGGLRARGKRPASPLPIDRTLTAPPGEGWS